MFVVADELDVGIWDVVDIVTDQIADVLCHVFVVVDVGAVIVVELVTAVLATVIFEVLIVFDVDWVTMNEVDFVGVGEMTEIGK